MGENTNIEWAHHTFNPWVGCTKVSGACDHCYAEGWAKRAGSPELWQGGRRRTTDANWNLPRKWDRQAAAAGVRHRVFCASLADVFDNQVSPEWRADLWALIRATPHLDWLLLTKRPQNIARMLPADWNAGWPNVWLGTSTENQTEANRRIPHLLAVPAAVRFLSCEPLLGAVDLTCIAAHVHGTTNGEEQWDALDRMEAGFAAAEGGPAGTIDWVICGGESGTSARPMHPDWARSLRDQCVAADVPFLFKQWGEWQHGSTLGAKPDRDAVVFNDGMVLTDFRRETAIAEDNARGWYARKPEMMARVGKNAAGRELDGRTWDQFPGGAA